MDKLTVFIALTGIAVALQAGVLLAMYLTMRKTTAMAESLAERISRESFSRPVRVVRGGGSRQESKGKLIVGAAWSPGPLSACLHRH